MCPPSTPDYNDLADRRVLMEELVRLRVGQGLSQRAVGAILGISQPAVSQIERGTDWQIDTLYRYARALGVQLTLTIEPEDDDE